MAIAIFTPTAHLRERAAMLFDAAAAAYRHGGFTERDIAHLVEAAVEAHLVVVGCLAAGIGSLAVSDTGVCDPLSEFQGRPHVTGEVDASAVSAGAHGRGDAVE